LSEADPDLYSRFREGFEELFAGGRSDKVTKLAEEILKPHGGFLFDGYKHEASPDCRKPLS
ncbi:MAG TPA: nucleotidyltransferase domain-containing protein, partial [Blastocatellia bacterium]|nr:nucleotidyltransferase domain-containing protein [Blastocatellia bacterium]